MTITTIAWMEEASKICAAHHVTLRRLRSRERTKIMVRARCAVATMLREERKLKFQVIGRLLNRDHTTIIALISPERRARIKATLAARKARAA